MKTPLAPLVAGVIGCAAAVGSAWSQTPPAPTIDTSLAQQLQRLAGDSAAAALDAAGGAARIEVELGQLDPRLTLAPCKRIEPYLPPGIRLIGRTRVALRCVEGPTHWNVYLPVTVKVIARALVTATALPAGSVLRAEHLVDGEADLAASGDPVLPQPELALGRTLARPLAAGEPLRRGDLKARQWFAAGDPVRVVAQGSGFTISVEGQAISHGLEGQPARVRTDTGRIVTGMPAGDRRVELRL